MNSKMTTNMEGYQWGRERERMGGKDTGIKKQNIQADVKNNIGNGEVKELICTIHGHELKAENAGGMGVQDREV